MTVAPKAIYALYDRVTVSSKVLSGIAGDASHSFGYHVARNQLPPTDYSVVLPLDKLGASNCASALDIGLSTKDMILVSHRLLVACQDNDPRVSTVREFFGADATDTVVIGWDRHDPNNTHDDTPSTSDDSHLWHVHISMYRVYANNAAAIAPIADVINGVPISEGLVMDKDVKARFDKMDAEISDTKAEVVRLSHIILFGRPDDPKTKVDEHVSGLEQVYEHLPPVS